MFKRNFLTVFTLVLFCFFIVPNSYTQTATIDKVKKAASAMKLRGIGPAFMGGRIADIAISPTDFSTWYIAVGSGGVWKTTNSGITFKPVFDDQASYSIGSVTIDPNNPQTVWVGTGENVSGRHVAWGDGVYKSDNGGASWESMGLKTSEHIGKILIDPRNSDVVFVAAEGPLWSSGGERGLYRSEDGGKSWALVLEIDENTGVTDVEFDPSNPEVLYAAAYQRRRQTWSFLAGGPKSGIYKSIDNGLSWKKVTMGLPKGDVGKIGLAVTPADPNRVYATIEANDDEKGFYRSMDKGESWEKRNSYISGGTGPHYYQEIEASPTTAELVYQMDVFYRVSRDGGKTFKILGNGREKHSDNHALWIDPNNGKHLLSGTDGGLYESFDEGTTWRHFPNLPISQFYKVGVDNAEPFYNIVGGAQDLGTLIGPSRTTNVEGVRNQDWYVPLGADGYESVFDPEDPNTVYMEIQQGLLHRLDRRTEEVLNIQPQPAPGDAPERWNWDSPLIISPHNHKRLYFGSQRLWRSDDRGNSWTAISPDLTTNTNRYELETLGRVWSIDALYDTGAMSKYATLTGISESPLAEGLLYTASDDGMVQVSEDAGANWRRSAALPKVPIRSFINDVEASSHNENTVFAVADAHKFGDYSPYVFMSADRGRSWKSIAGDLPAGTIVWVIKQDPVDENLLFAGTEYGIYFSPNKGVNWIKLGAGAPTIAFRDLELHPRDNDLIGATFGRGFYILDDYTPLRNIANTMENKSSVLFPVRDTWWYVPSVPMQAKGMPGQGTTSFATENPPFGAMFTYYIEALPETMEEKRKAIEKKSRENNANIPFPGWERLKEESLEEKSETLLLVSDKNNTPIRWIKGETKAGVHRTHWDLKLSPPDAIDLSTPDFVPPWAGDAEGPLAAPGTYSVSLYLLQNGTLEQVGAPQQFKLKPTPNSPSDINFEEVAKFQERTNALLKDMYGASSKIGEVADRIRHMKAALLETPKANTALFAGLKTLETKLAELRERLYGHPIKNKFNEATAPSIMSRAGSVAYGHWGTRQMPTETQQENIRIAETDFKTFKTDMKAYMTELMQYEAKLQAAGAPYTPGRVLE
ncbi:WD40/YVTN/BNR-like repeat-containing protein [Maribacter chungangensis]|uniref:WD40/YVTN/BNR-like repeat-containing protein n=1 Tax=Maribacter chungangensis TaxID=1069117 RepID=A0ABW3B589_9FLAO